MCVDLRTRIPCVCADCAPRVLVCGKIARMCSMRVRCARFLDGMTVRRANAGFVDPYLPPSSTTHPQDARAGNYNAQMSYPTCWLSRPNCLNTSTDVAHSSKVKTWLNKATPNNGRQQNDYQYYYNKYYTNISPRLLAKSLPQLL